MSTKAYGIPRIIETGRITEVTLGGAEGTNLEAPSSSPSPYKRV